MGDLIKNFYKSMCMYMCFWFITDCVPFFLRMSQLNENVYLPSLFPHFLSFSLWSVNICTPTCMIKLNRYSPLWEDKTFKKPPKIYRQRKIYAGWWGNGKANRVYCKMRTFSILLLIVSDTLLGETIPSFYSKEVSSRRCVLNLLLKCFSFL